MAAAGKWKIYEQGKKHLNDGTIDLDTDTFKMTLHSSASNANTLSGSSAFADITNELATADGYTAGGVTLTGVTWTNSAGVETFDANDVVWNVVTASLAARFAVIRKSGTANGVVDPILAVSLLDTTPADVVTTPGNAFTVQIAAGGIFQLSGGATD